MGGGRSIMGRMLGWVLGVTGLILLAVILWSYHIARDRLERDMAAKAVSLTDGAARRIDARLGYFQGVVDGMAAALESNQELAYEQARAMQSRFLQANQGAFGVCVAYDPAFKPAEWPVSGLWGYRAADGLDVADMQPADFTDENWFAEPKQLNRPVWSDAYKWNDIIMVTYSAPFYHEESGERLFAGVVTCDLALDWLEHMIAGLPLGPRGYGLLMSRNGMYIAHPMHELVLNETVFSIADKRNEPELHTVGRQIISGKSGVLPFESFVTGDLSWLAYTPLQTTDWIMAALISWDEMNDAILDLSRRQAKAGAAGMLLLTVAVWLIARSITRPICRLQTAAETLAGGNMQAHMPAPQGRDEVAGLTQAFGTMRDNLVRYMNDLQEAAATREKMQSELRIAHDIQMGLVPKNFPPFSERTDMDLYAMLEPAREVGGDFYDFFLLEDREHMVAAIGDVSGKGVPAALFMAVTRSFVRAAFRSENDPAAVLRHVNRELLEGNDTCMFVTLFLMVYRLSDGRLKYANAGHNPPLIRHAGGSVEQLAEPHGALAGVMPGISYSTGEKRLAEGDTLLLYTDGVTEAMNSGQQLYGDDRLEKCLMRTWEQADCKEVINMLLDDIGTFAEGAEQSDDITMLALQRKAAATVRASGPVLELAIANSQEDLQRALHELDEFISVKRLPPKTACSARLALEELVSNTIKYGYDDDRKHIVQVCFVTAPEPVMEFIDDGHAFNPLEDAPQQQLDVPLQDRKTGGLGLHILRETGFKMTYQRDNQRNRLVVELPDK